MSVQGDPGVGSGVHYPGVMRALRLGLAACLVANLALGLLISTLTRTQAQAMQLGFFFMPPNILLSGFMFPRGAMPEAAQWIGAVLPLTYFLRGILLRGVGLEALWREVALQVAFSLAFLVLSLQRFPKTMD